MEKLNLVKKISELYKEGGNIIQFLKDEAQSTQNSIEDILISYDFQAGSYTQAYFKNKEYIFDYTAAIYKEFQKLGKIDSILEIGVGEGTTLGPIINHFDKKPSFIFGIDISWSRIKAGVKFINFEYPKCNPSLAVADLFSLPFADNSIDVVYTSHSIEPNGGKEAEALKELYRVAKDYIVLLEPSYHFGSKEAKVRIRKNGYIEHLYKTAQKLDYKIIEYRLFEHCSNPLNPTELIIIKKKRSENTKANTEFVCPISKSKLLNTNDAMFCEELLVSYPKVQQIPCLMSQNAILTTRFLSD